MRKTFMCLGACLLLASTALPAGAQSGGGGSGGGSSGPSVSGGGSMSGGGGTGGGSSVGRSSARPSGAIANRGGTWAGRSGNWSGHRRVVRRNHAPAVIFGFGTGWVGNDYAYDNCGWVRVKRIIRHRAVWQRVYRCF